MLPVEQTSTQLPRGQPNEQLPPGSQICGWLGAASGCGCDFSVDSMIGGAVGGGGGALDTHAERTTLVKASLVTGSPS